ncbi:hypothetical protein OKW27_003089 [Paraburkholderia sp. 35.1]
MGYWAYKEVRSMHFLGTRCSPCRIRSGGLACGCCNAETPGHLTNVKTLRCNEKNVKEVQDAKLI